MGSARDPLAGLRCGWDTGSSPSTRVTADTGSAPQRRLRPLCSPGYIGRKRGEVVRTRTTVLQMHTHQWVASFVNPGNGRYREELRRAKEALEVYIPAHRFSTERMLLRLDDQYETGAVVSDLADFSHVTRGKDYKLLDRAYLQARLHLPVRNIATVS